MLFYIAEYMFIVYVNIMAALRWIGGLCIYVDVRSAGLARNLGKKLGSSGGGLGMDEGSLKQMLQS